MGPAPFQPRRARCPVERASPGRPGLQARRTEKSRMVGRGAAGRGTWPQREDSLPLLAAEGEVMAAVSWPEPSQQAGAQRGSPHVAWSDFPEEPGPRQKARSLLVWLTDEEAKDGDSSVSSGRLSGSSGGHESCTPPHGTWKERTLRVLGPLQQPRESTPRLEQLREKIRAQARWQASCTSLGTSAPASASDLYKARTPAPRRKARKPTHPAPALAYPGILSGAESGVEDKATPGQGREASRVSQRQASVPQEKTKRMKSRSCKREKTPKLPAPRRAAKDTGHGKKLGAGESSPVCPRLPRSTSARSAPQVSTNAPHLASCHQPVNIQAAMAVLRDLHQQIQASLELAQGHHPRRGLEPRDLAGRRWQSPWKPPDLRGSWKSPRAVTEGVPASKRAGSLPMAPSWSASDRWESYPQRTWAAQGRDPSFRGPGSPTERLNSFPQRPWSASARRTSCPPKTWAAQGWDLSLWRPGSTPERWGPFLQQPRSTSSGQAWGLQRAWTSCEDREGPARRPWSPAFTQGPDPRCQGRGPLLTPAGAKLTWPRPSQGALWNMPGKENEVRPPPPCPKPRGPLHSSESLREFIQQKMEPWWQQALKEKASATQALELRNQRLQGVYRKQREAVPVVSQTTPGIVTFVPHSAQSGGLEATGGPGAPVPQWSRVTSGMVLGDQDAPGSFCLCLNRALNPAETLEVGGPRDGWEGAPPLTSASSSLGPLQLQDVTSHCSSPGLCIYLDPEESERLGTPGPLHLRYKQARLQALETMANVLKQRIDVLTDRLSRSEATDAAGGPVPGPPPSSSSTPACPRALVPSVGGGAPWDWAGMRARPLLSTTCFPDTETLPWSPGWERLQSVSPRGHQASKPQGFMEDGRSELDKRQARTLASFQTLSPFAGSSLGAPPAPDPRCGSLRLEEMRSARGAGLVTPLTLRSCGKGEPVDRPWAGWSGGQGDPLGTRSTA
ncbi:coiled-coil domain-containing protein 187 [Lagenorhynchus albirostris]|uniref:coiled-coil domain-containing protein 187 n=1 Tax=Lagenorhynchus albirostris TaxID=27610 RepID=UPI0028E887B5|nr:coiled-coil domain-containing protein 187 [Lagenorhynchus albirostris]